MNNLVVENLSGQLVVDSRLVAQQLGIEHRSLKENIKRHADKLKTFNRVPLDSILAPRNPDGSGGETYYYLNEDTATYLMLLSQNSEQVVEAKYQLVLKFSQAKALLSGISTNRPTLTPFEDTVAKVNCLLSILITTGVEKGIASQIGLNTIKQLYPEQTSLLNGMAKEAGVTQASDTSYHSPTELALLIKEKDPSLSVSARTVNTILLEMGWQKKLKKDYSLTELGSEHGAAIPFGIPNSKKGGFHLRWKTEAVDLICDYING